MKTAEWREIPNHPGYRVSDDGRVESRWEGRCPRRLGASWKPLTISPDTRGYLKFQINTKLNGTWTPRAFYIHHVVLSVFVGPRPPGMLALHNNDIKTDNCLGNLRWGTMADNVLDAKRNGRTRRPRTGRREKLDARTVRRIRSGNSSGKSIAAMARRYGVNRTTVSAVVRRRSWRHVA